MSSEVEELRRLLAEEQRLRAEEQRLRAEEQRLRAEDQEKISKTSLPTFLDGLHKHLFLGLGVQQDTTQSTRGDPANAANKLRPRKLKAWDSFAQEQEEIWRLLMDSSLVEQRLFTSLHTLEETGESIRRRPLGSERDLCHFLRQTVEDHVSKIIEELYKDPTLRQVFGLRGSICFENHSNTLSPERELEEGMQNIDLRSRPRRRSPRIAARDNRTSSTMAPSGPRTPPLVRSTRPRADQFCVYNIPSEASESIHRVAAYVKEYKSPHKVTLGHIYEGLEDMDIDAVVEQKEDETPKDRFRRAIAGLLVQPHDYMIRAGTEMGVLSTGEADIYLRIGDDPGTLLYHLSVPKGDVGDSTDWDPHSNGPNRLHLTAVGQSLAFTLQALKLRPRNQAWRQQAVNSLPRWEVIVADILDSIRKEDVPSSEYRPPRMNGVLRMSPIQLRRRRNKPSVTGCQPTDTPGVEDDEQSDPDTPSRDPRLSRNIERRQRLKTPQTPTPDTQRSSGENNRYYCTLKCLRGLVCGDELDQACPNVLDHGTTRHVINAKAFVKRLRRQLSETVNADCEALGIHGSRGALLKVTLSSHGYTVPAKCTISEFSNHLRHEAAVYHKLRSLQGICIPLHLGTIELVHPYSYDGIAYLKHMMLLSPGGQSPGLALREMSRDCLEAKMKESLSQMHRLNVFHKDPAPRNWFYNRESEKVVFIDFERAEIVGSRPILGTISPNHKRKRMHREGLDKLAGPDFTREINKAVWELQGWR
ncbi:hypothetical protein BO70DRAFT_359760 [Aspergillus heteromorphus CBS 117.55]|uniref:Protein kinase domain-containing protein n=1 Tax=Aspergillus heteromorphus CBS 117.55 TaxID=1448321 RepID=A0A317WVM1_9EURO|nr:uncharacterized protein BO70DRAFT_359760 [Aspergillus heteromorphus CBS 117.55]PWY88320.1 hypothetical protein BO70DRAFT_359760 [Aspergillus heteromorphus CBS 117.55]